MQKSLKNKIAVFFTILFMVLISAPTVISSVDDSVDVSCFFCINEEEENENVKLVFENNLEDLDQLLFNKTASEITGYTFKAYPNPYLNLIFPPPELS